MGTIADLTKILDDQLKAIGIEESEWRAERERILDHLTETRLAQRMADPQKELPIEIFERAEGVLKQRQGRVPLQYILGETYFYGMKFLLRSGVLIPRADTETLVEAFIEYFGTERVRSLTLGEIGIGSGIISVCILKQIPSARSLACDISQEAIDVSQQNADLHAVGGRLSLSRMDWREWLPGVSERLDAIVSNPPYIPQSLLPSLAPEVREHEPASALFGAGDDGLDFYREFAALEGTKFRRQIPVFLEVGDRQAEAVSAILADKKWVGIQCHKDMNGVDRVVSAISPQ
ncbi:MAG: peptide chain release factor N(5)-glutamine methyltransferase [Candidatus Obscuribacterales bacterium]|nr:peptide chain release factor N(5)-glutamine methyltransferase [Candidatus Obscuribacterales bacterium]